MIILTFVETSRNVLVSMVVLDGSELYIYTFFSAVQPAIALASMVAVPAAIDMVESDVQLENVPLRDMDDVEISADDKDAQLENDFDIVPTAYILQDVNPPQY